MLATLVQSKREAAAEKKPRRLPGVEGVWVFVGADMMFFAVLFASFMVERGKNPEVFESSRLLLNQNFGGINTLILVTSSLFVFRAVDAARNDRLAEVPRQLMAGLLCGVAFWIAKIFEYGEKLAVGITPKTNDFFMLYFTLTGLHLLHVTAGCILLGVLWKRARARQFHSGRFAVLESGGTYWHMVDLLWIVLFPLLYLMI